jgi:hypothetical protein
MSSLISEIQRHLQYAVSGDKYRYREGGWDLDLTYITPRIIAMGIPGEGVSSNWRNNVKEVAAFLHSKHQSHFKIINVSGESYNYQIFDNRVVDFPFPDHHPPPLALYLSALKEMHSWLISDPANVVAVHCLAGRSRTGTIVSGYLLYSSFSENALTAISYFNNKRSLEARDVCLPSQIRYVGYMDALLRDHERKALTTPTTRVLRAVVIRPPFRLEGSVAKGKATWKPFLCLKRQALPQDTIFNRIYSTVSMDENEVRLEVPNLALCADVVLKLGHVAANPITYGRVCMKVQKVFEAATSLDSDLIVDIARISFHTAFLEGNSITFEAFEIDAHKAGPIALDSKYIPSNLTITLELEPLSDTPQTKPATAHSNPKLSPAVPRSDSEASPISSDAKSPKPASKGVDARVQVLPSKSGRFARNGFASSSDASPKPNAQSSLSPAPITRARGKSDPPLPGGGVKLNSGLVVYSHDELLPKTSPQPAVPFVHPKPNLVPVEMEQPPYVKSDPGSHTAPKGPVVDGSVAGLHGVKVHEGELSAIAEFQREQAARKQAALAAHAGSVPVQNIYIPSPNGGIVVHQHVKQQTSPVVQVPATGYPPGYVAPAPATTTPPTGFPPGYAPSSQPSPRRRPASVHYGAVPNYVAAQPWYVQAKPATVSASPKAKPNPYAPSSSSNPYASPNTAPAAPYPTANVDAKPYVAPAAVVPPEGWPPGYTPAPASVNPYAPTTAIASPPNPYAPTTAIVSPPNPYANPYANPYMAPPPY